MFAGFSPKAILGLILGSIGGLFFASPAVHAQQTMNPPGFDPYSAPYRAYAFPGAGDNPAITNSQMSARPLTTVNNFGRLAGMDDGLSGDDGLNPFPNGGRFQRYDSSYRAYDRSLGREFSPNGKSDSTYFSDRQRKEELQIKLMRETDPKKIEVLKRQIDKVGDRTERASEDTPDAYLSVRRSGGSSSSSAVGASPRRSSAGSLGVAPTSRAGTAPRALTRASDTAYGATYAPSPSSVLERSRRMTAATSTTPPAVTNPPAPR